MTTRTDQREAISAALREFNSQPSAVAAKELFDLMGYRSNRALPISTPAQFQKQLDPNDKLTDKERATLDEVQSLDLLFQLTDAELGAQASLFDDEEEIQDTMIESYLFFAAELPSDQYTRTSLATLVRIINKPLPMPALVLFKHGERISVGIIHRRLHKRNRSKDVLEKVTLIKDINYLDPIRAHIEILNDFVLENLDADYGISNFVRLHEAWKKRIDSFALSKNFYREIADWYFWAHHLREQGAIRLPLHCDTEEKQSLFFIRLLTRVIFCWFLIEKRLIPTDLFREHRLKNLLKDFHPSRDSNRVDDAPTYYRAVLQNLFFGTLNMPAEQRSFREQKKEGEWYDKSYGITNLWRYEDAFRDSSEWIELAQRIPFLNGGLFDCLDDKAGRKTNMLILDGFSDREDYGCHLPNDLFFGPDRVVDLSRDYGEEKKARARSKKAKVRGLVEILSHYKFTIEENTPLEEEIALDPELLGKVFENLLASYNEDTRTTARKALGAFYTPREIVSYMVDEALKSYLSTQVPRCKGALDDLFSDVATLKEINPKTRDGLIAAIGKVKILDPACGSGAFPMGALGRLVDLLQKLDPDNDAWKRDRLKETKRYRDLLLKLGADNETIAEHDARIIDVEKSFDTRYHELDFARKLYLVENCIYGVDIQPIATQIAKLRVFISLVVDQKVDEKAANLGVRPLPNLETRIVAADTLHPLPIPEERQGHLFDDADPEAFLLLTQAKAELTSIRHEHFNARSPSAKRKWREADEAKRTEIAALLEENHTLPGEIASMLARWNPYDQNNSAPFFDSEWMFGLPVGKVRVEKLNSATLLGRFAFVNEIAGQTELIGSMPQQIDSGFDVVIGNPPYVRIQTLKRQDPKLVAFYKSHYASAAKGNYDLYVVFIEAGLRLLKSNGHLAYICPHKFFNAKYGEALRGVISAGRHLRHVVHFGEQQVFPGASIYTCLLFLAREGVADCRIVGAYNLDAWKATRAGTEGKFAAMTIGKGEWSFALGKGRAVFEKLQALTQTLESVTTRIFQGIKTSADKIYIVEERRQTKSRIVVFSPQTEQEHEVEPDLFRPLIKGGDSRAFILTKTNRLILFPYAASSKGKVSLIPAATLKKDFPLTWAYLATNREYLEGREDGKFIGEGWYAYGRSQALAIMTQPKLFTPDLALSASFAFDEGGELFFTGGVAGGYGLLAQDNIAPKFLLALLNSHAVDFFHHQIATQMRGGWYSYEARFIKRLPIAAASSNQTRCTVGVVEYLLCARRNFLSNPDSQTTRDPLMLAYWERVLNGLVYELYFPEEVHGSGLLLFDLVAQAQLPDIQTIPEVERLPRLRKLFETLHDGSHPLRIALDKLQTLDIVRIIEGKE